MGHPRRQAKSTFCMHCPGSGKRHWDGWARALFCLLRWRTGGCSLVYDEERRLCLLCLQSFSFFLLSFGTHDDIRVFWTLGEFRAWEASTWNVLMSIMDFGGAYIFTTATRSRAQRPRIRTNAAEQPWLGNIRRRLSLADDQTDEVEWLARFLNSLAMLKKPLRQFTRIRFGILISHILWNRSRTTSARPFVEQHAHAPNRRIINRSSSLVYRQTKCICTNTRTRLLNQPDGSSCKLNKIEYLA